MTVKITINGPTRDAERQCDIWTADVIVKDHETQPAKEQSWLTKGSLNDMLQSIPTIIQNLCLPK